MDLHRIGNICIYKLQNVIRSQLSYKTKLTDSNNAPFNPMLPEGVRPRPPTKPAHISERISPYKFGIT